MKTTTKHKVAGFTLVELLVAMGITMVLLYAAVSAFRDASYSNQVVTSAADMTDNLRAGINMIELDLQQTGSGLPSTGIPIPYTSNGSSAAPCSTTTAVNRPVLNGVGTFPLCNQNLPAIEPGNALGPLITAPDATAGNVSNPNSFTDEITVVYKDNTIALDTKPINQPATPGPPASPGCPLGSINAQTTTVSIAFDPTCADINPADNGGILIQPGDLIWITNSVGGALLTVSTVAPPTITFAPHDAFNLNGRSDTSGTINQMQTSAGCGGKPACFPPTTAMRVVMVSYYLDNTSSPPYIRLIRQVNFKTPTPVGETLENLQFTYNFVDGLTNPSNQPGVPSGNSESNIRSVNVYLGARSTYMVKNGNKSVYARNNLMSQVSLRSMAFVNRYN